MGQEGLVVAALLASIKTSWKVEIYYINGALLKSIFTHCKWENRFSILFGKHFLALIFTINIQVFFLGFWDTCIANLALKYPDFMIETKT